MIQIRPVGLCGPDDDEAAALRQEFDRIHCIRIREFFAPELVKTFQARIAQSRFFERLHKGIGVEECMDANATKDQLNFLINDERVLELVRRLTGAAAIAGFHGRVYRMAADPRHYDSWHSDRDGTRTIGMSLNLSVGVFRGGELRLRREESETHFLEVANTGQGDAIFFRIADGLVHKVEAVVGDVPRTVFAGWFTEETEFASRVLAPGRRLG